MPLAPTPSVTTVRLERPRMTRSSIVTLATLSLLFGCASKQETPTSSPGTAADPGASADGGAADDGGPKPQVRMSTSSGSAGLQKAGPKAKPSKLISKKPPKAGDDKKPSGAPVEIDPGTPVELAGFFPPVAGVGSHVEIFGSNFAPSAKNNTVTIGGK